MGKTTTNKRGARILPPAVFHSLAGEEDFLEPNWKCPLEMNVSENMPQANSGPNTPYFRKKKSPT